MKRLIILAALASFHLHPASAQEANQKPIIVERLVLNNQTQILGSLTDPIPLFTPTHDGLYRATAYMQATGNPALGCVSTCAGVDVVYAPSAARNLAGFGYDNPSAFRGVAGQTIGYYTFFVPGSTLLPYDFYIVIEEL